MIKQLDKLNQLLNQASNCPTIFEDIKPELSLDGSFSLEFFIFNFSRVLNAESNESTTLFPKENLKTTT